MVIVSFHLRGIVVFWHLRFFKNGLNAILTPFFHLLTITLTHSIFHQNFFSNHARNHLYVLLGVA
ncbi:hypothetical protein MtrunA17_Chr4g0006441 [Medicago truncatula]|uniref:Transmembrane protein, putative n=1 Tax=Medicago truncatula TaxID=3880 RepID=G8A2M5_MEDTR|nr:transmembrane protein, putative [Medicago truncatula]RHN58812.1 hypothetical protein MtrunA17_Chr4g0006441 [Medicago truncatula]